MSKDKKKTKVVLTGGHLSPLLAVLDILLKKADCVVIGRRHTFEEDNTESLEFQVISDLNVRFYNLTAGRLQRKISKQTIPSLLKFPGAYIKAGKILARERPDVVLTFGGYVGLPVALAAYLKGIPVVLHEQTMQAGLTNRLIGKIASVVCISFITSAPFFPAGKTILTGNPIRQDVFRVQKEIPIPQGKPVLFVTGGSTGAHSINEFVEYLLPKLLDYFVVIHQTGDSQTHRDFNRLVGLAEQLPVNMRKSYIPRKFILPSEIGWVYKSADVVLSRSGANTVAELIALQKKALLIPLPEGQRAEQLMNAKFYEETNLGTYIEQKDVELSSLFKTLVLLERKKIKEKKDTVYISSAQKITAETLKVASGRGQER